MLAYVREGPVAVVVEEMIPSERRDVEIDKTIPVIVRGGYALRIGGQAQTGLRGDIGEMQEPILEIVAEKLGLRIAQRIGLAALFERPALHYKDIQIAIVVVVQERYTGRRKLHHIPLSGHAIVVLEHKPGFAGGIAEWGTRGAYRPAPEKERADEGGTVRRPGNRHRNYSDELALRRRQARMPAAPAASSSIAIVPGSGTADPVSPA